MHTIIAAIFVMSCGDGYTPPDNTVIIDENNMMMPAGSAEVAVGFPSGPLLEGGAPATVTVALKLAPTAPVTITLASSDEAAGTIAPATLTFDGATWAAPQTVTLTPVDDEVATGDKAWELRFEMTSDDASFAGKPVAPLKLTTIDNDAAPTIVAAAVGAPQTTELGGGATISVQLSKQPESDVLIPITLSDPAEADLNANTLTFTTLNWNVAQQVAATGKDDKQKDGDKAYKVIFGPATRADEEWNSIGPAEVVLTSIDGVCGNGVVDGAEPCEPTGMNECEFGQMDCMVCNTSCQLVPGDVTGFCGDGIVQSDKGEACDEPTAQCGYGEMSCMVCGPQCQRVAGQPSGFCGDGMTQGAQEQCDAPEAPCAYGQMSCMACRACRNVPGQVTGFCGDGAVQAGSGEECDGAPTQTCSGNGVITCDAQCKNDGSRCFAIEQIAAGSNHGCAVMQGGAMRCWGSNYSGQLGDPSFRGDLSATPRLVTGLTGVAQVSGGGDHTCAVIAGGAVRCWGKNSSGQLGDSTSNDRLSPVAVTGLANATQLSGGVNHTCAVLSSGQARCWGSNLEGQLGTGAATGTQPTPQTVVSATGQGQLTGVAQISAGDSITCAVLTSGAARCWGESDAGNLGTGDYDDHASPTAVVGITNATQVAVRGDHACAALSNGQVKCWGSNLFGQLGNTSVGNLTATPVVVTGINNAVAVGVGIYSTCALLSNGQVKCWGYNSSGELGDGTYDQRDTPVTVSGIQGATALSVGEQHACVRLQSGEGRCWGDNTYSQLTQPQSVSDLSTPDQLNF